MKSEDLAAPRLRVKQVGELRLDPSRLVQERQGTPVGREGVWQAFAVALGLRLDPGQRPAFLLCLDRPGRCTVDIQHVVDGSALKWELSDRNAIGSVRIGS